MIFCKSFNCESPSRAEGTIFCNFSITSRLSRRSFDTLSIRPFLIEDDDDDVVDDVGDDDSESDSDEE